MGGQYHPWCYVRLLISTFGDDFSVQAFRFYGAANDTECFIPALPTARNSQDVRLAHAVIETVRVMRGMWDMKSKTQALHPKGGTGFQGTLAAVSPDRDGRKESALSRRIWTQN